MNNTDFFRIRTFSQDQGQSRPVTKDFKISTPKTVPPKEKRGINSLLEGSSKSHCNTFVGYSRIPHKYDHFHEKTIPSHTIGSFLNRTGRTKKDAEKDLILLSESLDLTQAKLFFTKQQIYTKVFELNKFSPHRKRLTLRASR